ncbi:MAG: serine/threonine-protein kinase, partial [Acidobacteriota bacterium]
MSTRHERARELFYAARQLPIERQEAFLAEACDADSELRQEVASLLDADRDDDFELPFDPSSDEAPTPVADSDLTAAYPQALRGQQQVGPFRILQKLGEGGMGEVYEAEQQAPVRRRVALKLLKSGLETKEVLARFESERQALAMMNHPNIARVLEAGATAQGRPYFAMELVHGEPITSYCDRHRLSNRDRIEIFIEICGGLQHAHKKGVIHRDIKPSNILVTAEDGRAVPKIIDFGVAKATAQRLTERTLFTELGQWIGTPEYMSPEQAEMTGLDIDTRTDVYSLGVLLYELLAGARPFDSRQLRQAGFDEMRRRIREDEPTRPSTKVSGLGDDSEVAARNRQADVSTLVRQLRGDLDWITLRALEKDRTRRYDSPADLAADLRRHLADEPVVAGPPTLGYRVAKLLRRHRAVLATGLLILALLATAVLVTVGLLEGRRPEPPVTRAAP